MCYFVAVPRALLVGSSLGRTGLTIRRSQRLTC